MATKQAPILLSCPNCKHPMIGKEYTGKLGQNFITADCDTCSIRYHLRDKETIKAWHVNHNGNAEVPAVAIVSAGPLSSAKSQFEG